MIKVHLQKKEKSYGHIDIIKGALLNKTHGLTPPDNIDFIDLFVWLLNNNFCWFLDTSKTSKEEFSLLLAINYANLMAKSWATLASGKILTVLNKNYMAVSREEINEYLQEIARRLRSAGGWMVITKYGKNGMVVERICDEIDKIRH